MQKVLPAIHILLSLVFCWPLGGLHTQTPALESLTTANGLSQGMVFDLLQDRKGFLWFATKDGLNRYDGYTFQTYQNDPFNPFSIAGNEVQTLFEDHTGRIWAGIANNGKRSGLWLCNSILSWTSIYLLKCQCLFLTGINWNKSFQFIIQCPEIYPAE